MAIIDILARFFLAFSHDTIIIPLVVLGYIWISRVVFEDAIILILMSMLFSFFLKTIFQVPLSPVLHQVGYAFPSGHMQLSVVLYGWLAFKTQLMLYRLVSIVLLVGIGLSLMHFGYHNIYDILGGVFFACVLMKFYQVVVFKNSIFFQKPLFFLATVLMITVLFDYQMPTHIWMAYYALLGFSVSSKIFKHVDLENIGSKIVTSVLCFSFLLLMKRIYSMHQIAALPLFLSQSQWIWVGFWIPASCKISSSILKKYR